MLLYPKHAECAKNEFGASLLPFLHLFSSVLAVLLSALPIGKTKRGEPRTGDGGCDQALFSSFI